MTDWLSVKAFAKKTGLSVAWVHVLIKDKAEGLEHQRPGHEHLISAASVRKFKKNGHTSNGTPKARTKAPKKNAAVKVRLRTDRAERASQ